MANILEEIFFSLVFFNGILACILLGSKILIKIMFFVYNYKKDDEEFEKRWEDCE